MLGLLRGTLLFLALFHLGAGGALMLSPAAQVQLAEWYGAQVPWSDATIYLLRVVGTFAVALGIAAALAARDPLRNRAVVWGFVALFLMRDVQRHVYEAELVRGFALSPAMNLLTTVFFLVLALLLAVPLWRLRDER